MKNPEIYIFIAVGFSILLNWITSRFSDLSIGLLNTAIGLVFAVTANLMLYQEKGFKLENPSITDYIWLLALFQFAFGILVVHSYIAAKRLQNCPNSGKSVRLRESFFYSLSVMFSFSNCYILAVFILYCDKIFLNLTKPTGALEEIILRFWKLSGINIAHWLGGLVVLIAVHFFREKIIKLARS